MDPEQPHPPLQRRSPLPIIPTVIGGLLLVSLLATLIVSLGPWQPAFSGARATVTPAEQIVYQDSLKHVTSKYGWTISAQCPFKPDGFHTVADVICTAPVGVLTDATITVTATQLSGATDRIKGICFRKMDVDNFYYFTVDELGDWYVGKVVDGTLAILRSQQVNAAIHPGTGVANMLTVKMRGSHFVVSANGIVLGRVDDATFALGGVGLGGDEQSDMLFTDLTISIPPD
jgi:hypothetical protein